MRRAARVDASQPEIVDALRRCGWEWLDTTRVGCGFPDGIAWKPGKTRLVEIKTATGKLTPDQEKFHQRVTDVKIIRSVEEALLLR